MIKSPKFISEIYKCSATEPPDYFAIYHNWFKIQIQCKVHTEYRPGKCEVLIFLKSIFKRGQNFSLVEE